MMTNRFNELMADAEKHMGRKEHPNRVAWYEFFFFAGGDAAINELEANRSSEEIRDEMRHVARVRQEQRAKRNDRR